MASVAKIAAIFILFGVTFLFGILPLVVLKLFEKKLASKCNLKKWIGLLNCFSGGVFFGTSFLHLLPETVELIEESFSFDYPIAEALAGVGFFLILFIENMIGACGYGHSHNGHSHHGHSHHMHDSGHENPAQTCIEDKGHEETSSFTSKSCVNVVLEQNGINGIAPSPKDPDKTEGDGQSRTVESKSAEKIKLEQNGECSTNLGYGAISHNDAKREELNITHNEAEQPQVVIESHNPESLAFRSVVLLFALSFHMIFEGLSVGLQKTDPDTWRIMGVLALHKCIVAFSVGLQLAEGFKRLRNIISSLVLLSIVAPIGVMIGYIVTETGEDSRSENIAAGVLQGLSIGSFIYVTFFEILNKELEKGRNVWKVFSTMLGFGVVVGLLFIRDGHHGET